MNDINDINNTGKSIRNLEEACNEWLSMKRLVVKRSTYAKYYTLIQTHILKDEFGQMKLSDINSLRINTFIYDKLTNGRIDNKGPLSPKTVRDIYTVLKAVINYAVAEYDLGSLAKNTVLPKKESCQYEILSCMEQAKLEDYLLEDSTNPRKAGMLLCLYTGLRIGEICALQWQDIDITKQTLQVRHTIQRIPSTEKTSVTKTYVVLDTPKSASSIRTIPLNPPIMRIIARLRGRATDEAFILTNRTDWVEPRNYQYFFHTCFKALNMRNVNFHILRHTFASRCVEAGFDIKSLSEILGHSNTDMTLNYYIHSSMDNKRKQMELLKF